MPASTELFRWGNFLLISIILPILWLLTLFRVDVYWGWIRAENRRVEEHLDANSPSFSIFEALCELFISLIRLHFGVNSNSIALFQILDKELHCVY